MTLIGEYNNSHVAQRRYVQGPGVDEPLVRYDGSGTSTRIFYHADERGSIVATSDSSGAMASVNTYDEYGIPGSGNTGRFQYTSQAWLPELGMYYYRARIYSPTLGRFLQTDPIGYQGGMNLYAHVLNDPVNATDPSGTCHRETWRMWWWSGDGKTPLGPVDGADSWDEYINCEGVFRPDTVLLSMPWGFDLAFSGSSAGSNGIKQCSVPARILAGNPNFVGRPGAFGATIRMGSAAIIPRQFGARPGTASMPSWMVSIASIIHGRSISGQSFMGVTDVMADDRMGASTLIQQNNLMARDPGLLLIEIEGGRDEYTTMVIPWPANMPCPHG